MEIPLEDARSGMVLADDVCVSGGVLLNKHQILDDMIIQLAATCGVTTITVTDREVPAAGSPAAAPAPPVSPEIPNVAAQPHAPPRPSTPKPRPTDATERPESLPRHPAPVPPPPPASGRTFPEISVHVSPDAMSATLVVTPPESSAPRDFDRAAILTVLANHEIVHGIDTAAIDNLVAMWSNVKRRYEVDNVAVGTPAAPSREGDFMMSIRCLNSRTDCDAVQPLSCYWEVAERHPYVERASKGQVIAEKQTGKLSPPGKNIYGAPVFSEEVEHCDITLEEHVAFSADGMQIVAQKDGIAYRADTAVGIIPVNFDGCFECTVASDAMSAEITVHPPGPGGALPDKTALKKLLAESGVQAGILDGDIDTLLALCNSGMYPAEPTVVARGLPPQNGNNGEVRYLFNTVTSLAPSISDKGQADYKSVNIVNSVTAGQHLATLSPPTDGSDGIDVTGKTLPAKPGAPARMPQGPHTVTDPELPDVLCAATDGIVRLSGSLVEVCEGFVVPGSVDFSTGNIEYNKSVIVSGDVKAGFNIHCGADLQVNGTIEDCHITVGGNVLCRFGFVGQGKGCIDAKGDVNLGFIKNQTVKSFRNITIAKEAINCTLLSRGTITLHGTPLSAAGGEVKARTSITVHTVGNHTGIKTLLEAGVDYLMAEELAMIESQEKTVAEHIRAIGESYAHFRKSIAGKVKFTALQEKKNAEFTTAIHQAQQQLAVLEDRKTIVSGKLHPLTDCFIRIEHAAYPGTLFKFGERHYLVKEELAGPKNVRYINHEIKIV